MEVADFLNLYFQVTNLKDLGVWNFKNLFMVFV